MRFHRAMNSDPPRWLVEALQDLLRRHNDDAFVIIEDEKSGKFVQFGRGPTLKLDLPLAALNAEETARAERAFRALGSEYPRSLVAPDPSEAGLPRAHVTLEYDFGLDSVGAARGALWVYDQVFGLADASLLLQEN